MKTPTPPSSTPMSDELEDELDETDIDALDHLVKKILTLGLYKYGGYKADEKQAEDEARAAVEVYLSHHTKEAVLKARYDEANNIAGNMHDNRECITCYNNLSKLDAHVRALKAELAAGEQKRGA